MTRRKQFVSLCPEPSRTARRVPRCNLHYTVRFACGAAAVLRVRCIDFVYYYPAQPIPFGFCGLDDCDGSFDKVVALADDSTMNRTFGIVDICGEAEVGTILVIVVVCSPHQ